ASDRRWLTTEEMSRIETIGHRDGIGFHLPGAFDKVLDIEHCYLQADPSNEIRLALKDFCHAQGWPFLHLRTKQGLLRNVIIRNNLAGEFMVTLVLGESTPEHMQALTELLVERFPQVVSVHG